jgi:GTPase Era involved in 16S rRNA processing
LDIVEKWLPEGEKFFTDGEYTDQTERFLASEIVREKVFLLTRQEIPYGVAVTIDEFTEKEDKNLIVISATIHTERDSHKGILIGKRGAMLKRSANGHAKNWRRSSAAGYFSNCLSVSIPTGRRIPICSPRWGCEKPEGD